MTTEIDEWIYSEDRKENDAEVIKTTYGYHVTWYRGEGKAIWFVDSKNDLNSDLVEKWMDELEKATPITADESVADKILK